MPDYRYFLAFRPDTGLLDWLELLVDISGQSAQRIKTDNFHLTLCLIAERSRRDRFIAPRVEAALAGRTLSACRFWLGRVHGGRAGAAVYAMGRQHEIQAFYRELVAHLAERNILPLYRASGLHPHVTLGYDACVFDAVELPREWVPQELLLIESEVGRGVHNVLTRWPLLPPRQGFFVFGDCAEISAPRPAARGVAA